MHWLQPTPPPYDPLEWQTQPLAERGRMACEAWALQGYGAPIGIYLFVVLKIAFYVGMWIWFCSFSPELGGLRTIDQWWLSPLAFQKAIVWSMLFEGLGLGCGSGPLTGRYYPPVGGLLYFLRPGTTKLPAWSGLPILGGTRRTWLDVLLYVALVGVAVRTLIAPSFEPWMVLALVVLVPLAGLADRTIFFALRAEHYWTTLVCFAFAGNWIAGAKAVQLALWFWAGVSKLNHHFPSVVGVMTSNSPFTGIPWFRRRMYRRYPHDLRPSRLATAMARMGTALELVVPTVLLLAPGGWTLKLGLVLMLVLHTFITSNVPMGVPLEWNVMVVYGGFALFWAHPDVTVLDVGSVPVAVFLVGMLMVLPLLGNLFPHRISFLLAMRYYAGNWAYSVWLFRGESHTKLNCIKTTSPWVYDQLERFYDHPTAVGLASKVLAFRMMHLHGRALSLLIPKAVDRFEDYEYLDGEIVAGMVLGWNFGDGHLHREALLESIQKQCDFDEGELRCIFVGAQPLGRRNLRYRIHDAKTGLLDEGEVDVRTLRTCQPWEGPAVVDPGTTPAG